MPERLVLCGEARRVGGDSILRLALSGRTQNITLRLENISGKLSQNVPGLLVEPQQLPQRCALATTPGAPSGAAQ
jgi:hypothetical protein